MVLDIAAALTLQTTLIIIGLTLFSILLLRKPKHWKALSQIPGPRKLPIFGNALDLYVEKHEIVTVLSKWVKDHGRRLNVTIGNQSRVVLMNRNDIEKVLTSNVHLKKADEYGVILSSWFGTGLLTSHGDKWAGHRKLLTPAFHFRVLENFIPTFNEQSKIFVENLKNFSYDQQTFDIFPYVANCAADMISETAMGTRINAQIPKSKGAEYVDAVCRVSELVFRRGMRPWFHPSFIWNRTSLAKKERQDLKIIHGFAENMIRDRKVEMVKNEGLKKNEKIEETLDSEENIYFPNKGKKQLALLDLLIDAQMREKGKEPSQFPLTDRAIREEVDTFMFEGHDTIMVNVSWTLFLLGSYPEAQVKAQEEIDSIFGDDKNRDITAEDLTKMKYLSACIKESLRIYPSVPNIGRTLQADLELDDKVTLPAGTTVYIIPFILHRDPEVFPDPENFIPERFFPENALGRHPFAYVPFSAGPRNCIGQKFAMMEIKVTLAQFLRNYNIKAIEKQENVKFDVDLILRPLDGIPVQISRRNKVG